MISSPTLTKTTENLSEKANEELVARALEYIQNGFKVLPVAGKQPSSRIKRVNKLRAKPINEANASFYFTGSDVDGIALLTGEKYEVVDVDAKRDQNGSLKQNLLKALEVSLGDVFHQLVIVRSKNNGLHIHYKAHQIGSCKNLALRYATPEEKVKGETKICLIEVKGEGGQINCPGTPGYEVIQGDFSDLPVLTSDERNTVIAICQSFDLVKEPELKGIPSAMKNLGEAPWTEFNRTHDHKWMVEEVCRSGFSVVSEDDTRIYILRDGSTSKTSGSIWKESNILYLFSTSTQFEAGVPYSAFGMLCTLNYDGKVHDCAKDLAEQGIGTFNYDEGEFYTITKKGRVEFKYTAIKDWAHEIGIRKFHYSNSDFEIVQVVGNRVRLITIDKIKKTFGDYITKTVPDKVLNIFMGSIGKLFTKEGIISQLDELDEQRFIRCSSKIGWIFFNNSALKITKDEIEETLYEDLPGLIWEKRIIQRSYREFAEDCHPKEFIQLLSGGKQEVEERFRIVVGYLMHLYKDPVEPKVIIFNDEFFDANNAEPQGGTGKGLFIKLLKQFVRTLSLDGKRFDAKRNFAFQGISPDTQLIVVEDAAKGFCFETLFSTITEDLVIEKKGKDEYRVPYENSPKWLVTTNYAIKGNSSSHRRRRYELEVSPFFSDRFRPIDHFKKRFFEDWDEKEWLAFDNYMVKCLQMFLKRGLPEQKTVNLEKKRVIQSTNRDFFHWIEDMYTNPKTPSLDKVVRKAALMEQFTNLYPDYAFGRLKITQTLFTRWLSIWCDYRNIVFDPSNDLNGAMAYRFQGELKGPYSTASDDELSQIQNLVSRDESSYNSPYSPGEQWQPITDEELF